MSKLYAVGIGPGRKEFMTEEALEALNRSELIIGYTVYADQVRGIFPEKEYITTPMKQEIDRCRMALEAASAGRTTAMVCSGDAGVYGMAGLLIQLESSYPGAEVEVVAGVTAGISGAAVLGAPLGHDFCVISLLVALTGSRPTENPLSHKGRGEPPNL